MSDLRPCGTCDGEGVIRPFDGTGNRWICPHCSGTGKVRRTVETISDSLDKIQKILRSELIKQSTTKCLVKGCTNHKHEGTFVRDLCSPCHEMLTTGNITGNGDTFLHWKRFKIEQQEKRIEKLKAAANWFSMNVPGSPVPDWVDKAMNGV